jgi:Flp pilus assembly protein TadG
MRRVNQRGHAMIELAVSAAVMMSCVAGTVQFGYTFYIYNELVTAVGNGGRYAAIRTYRSAGQSDIEKGKAAIRNMVAFGDSRPAPDALPQVANLKPEQVRVD